MGRILAPNVMPAIPARLSGNCRFMAEGSLTSFDEECRMYGAHALERREEGMEREREERRRGACEGEAERDGERKSETERERN